MIYTALSASQIQNTPHYQYSLYLLIHVHIGEVTYLLCSILLRHLARYQVVYVGVNCNQSQPMTIIQQLRPEFSNLLIDFRSKKIYLLLVYNQARFHPSTQFQFDDSGRNARYHIKLTSWAGQQRLLRENAARYPRYTRPNLDDIFFNAELIYVNPNA